MFGKRKTLADKMKNAAAVIEGLKFFEEKGWISYDNSKNQATVDKVKFEASFPVIGKLDFKTIAHACAMKVFLEKSAGKEPEEINKMTPSITLIDLQGNKVLDYTIK